MSAIKNPCKINPLVSEDVFLEVVQQIVDRYAKGYSFGIYEKQDIAQEMTILAWEALPKYDGVRSLYNFLSTHIQNRTKNLKRNKWFRATCPCKLCDGKENGETGHTDKLYCKRFKIWKDTNNAKCNIASPPEIPEGYDSPSHFSPDTNMCAEEIKELIDLNLPVHLRETYLRIKSGLKVNKDLREQVLLFIRQLINGEE